MIEKRNIWTILDGVIETEQLVNGYIFYGIDYIILQQAAYYFVEQYFNKKASFSLTADTLKNTPDLYVFSAETNSIKIEDIRHIQERVKYGPSQQNQLFVIIEHADQLTVQAANAFLKTLEEPLDRITFILLTTKFKQLIPTIVSRSQSLFISQYSSRIQRYDSWLETEVVEEKMTYKAFKQRDKIEQLTLIEQWAKEKHTVKQHLESWVEQCYKDQDFAAMDQVYEVLSRLEYNVNTRCQLEQLVLS